MHNGTGYFPFGFTYPKGFPYSATSPDPALENIRKRMLYLNKVHALSGLPGHIFAAAMAKMQQESYFDVDDFWDSVKRSLKMKEVAQIAVAMQHLVADEPPRLEFPNAIALFDCRFVSIKEWEHVRRYSIGGSEAAAVMGASTFQSPRSIYHEKKTRCEEERSAGSQQILDYGHAVEPYVIGATASLLGAKQRPEYRMFAHKDYPFITCNPDGILEFPDGSLVLFEAKTAFWRKRDDWKGGIPKYYQPQPRQYLAVLNDPRLMRGYISVCLGGLPKDLLTHEYERDLSEEKKQVAHIVRYWKTYIERSVLPPFCGNSELDFNAHYGYQQQDPLGNGITILDADTIPEFERYFDLKADKDALAKTINSVKEEENEIQKQIVAQVPEGMTLVVCENNVTYRIRAASVSRDSVSLPQIETVSPDDANILKAIARRQKDSPNAFTMPKITQVIPKIPKKRGATKAS